MATLKLLDVAVFLSPWALQYCGIERPEFLDFCSREASGFLQELGDSAFDFFTENLLERLLLRWVDSVDCGIGIAPGICGREGRCQGALERILSELVTGWGAAWCSFGGLGCVVLNYSCAWFSASLY